MDKSYRGRKVFPKNSVRRSRLGRVKLLVCPTTGGHIELSIPADETIHGLKCAISRNLRIHPGRINLLYKDKILKDGTLRENLVVDNSQITLLPSMESGLSVQRPEIGVIQALEKLTGGKQAGQTGDIGFNSNSTQMNDFLSGKSPLVLAMRLGDHMMFVQLQLSTSPCSSRRPRGGAVSATNTNVPGEPSLITPTATLNPASLVEATRNLSEKLKELTKIASPKNVDCATELPPAVGTPSHPVSSVSSPTTQGTSSSSPPPPRAVIDSMQHLGKGVYSGTFSGTLDPSLQDTDGKPKRDISTIIQILNDLIGATPQYRHQQFMQSKDMQTSSMSGHRPKDNQREQCNNAGYEATEEEALRGKVRQLQLMMEERRMRRKARRETRAPYQWASNAAQYLGGCSTSHGVQQQEAMDLSENPVAESSSYAATTTGMEQESVAV